MDQVGEQRDASAGEEDRELSRRRRPEDQERETDRLQPGAGALDRRVEKPVRVSVAIVIVAAVIAAARQRSPLAARVGMRAPVRVGVDQIAMAMHDPVELLVGRRRQLAARVPQGR